MLREYWNIKKGIEIYPYYKDEKLLVAIRKQEQYIYVEAVKEDYFLNNLATDRLDEIDLTTLVEVATTPKTIKGVFVVKYMEEAVEDFLRLKKRAISNLPITRMDEELLKIRKFEWINSSATSKYEYKLTVALKEDAEVNDLIFINTEISNYNQFLDQNAEKSYHLQEDIVEDAVTKQYLDYLKDKAVTLSGKEITAGQSKGKILLEWNGDKIALAYVFKQLKEGVNKKGETLLPHSYYEIAEFLKNNFKCFASTKLSTIRTQLKTADKMKKQENKIRI